MIEHINPSRLVVTTAPSTSPHIIAMPPFVNSASHQGHFSLFNGPRAFYSFQRAKKAGSAGRSETAQTASSPRTLAASSSPPPSTRLGGDPMEGGRVGAVPASLLPRSALSTPSAAAASLHSSHLARAAAPGGDRCCSISSCPFPSLPAAGGEDGEELVRPPSTMVCNDRRRWRGRAAAASCALSCISRGSEWW